MPYYYIILILFLWCGCVYLSLCMCIELPMRAVYICIYQQGKGFNFTRCRASPLCISAKHKTAIKYNMLGSPLIKEDHLVFIWLRKTQWAEGEDFMLWNTNRLKQKGVIPLFEILVSRVFPLHSIPPRRSFFCLASGSVLLGEVHCFVSHTVTVLSCMSLQRKPTWFFSSEAVYFTASLSLSPYLICLYVLPLPQCWWSFYWSVFFLPVQYKALQLNEL